MNKDDVIRMARDAGGHELMRIDGAQDSVVAISGNDAIQRFAALVAAAEREECAKVCLDQRDIREEMSAALRISDAANEGDNDSLFLALRHESEVRLYNRALEKAAELIRERSDK